MAVVWLLPWLFAPSLLVQFGDDRLILALWPQACLFAVLGAVGVLYTAVRYLHRKDELVIDEDGVHEVKLGRRRTLRWAEIEEFHFFFTQESRQLWLRGGRHKIVVNLSRLADQPETWAKLKAGLAPLWQRRLQELAIGPVPVPLPPRLRNAWLQVVGYLVGYLGVAAALDGIESLAVVAELWPMALFLALFLAGSVAALMLLFRRSVGPDTVVCGLKTTTLSAVQTITVSRVAALEAWTLKGDGFKSSVSALTDAPLLYEHLIKRCPTATWEYDIRVPRTAVEAAFLPTPPTAPPELFAAADDKAVARAFNRQIFLVFPFMIALVGGLIAVILTTERSSTLAREAAFATRAVPVTGELYRTERCWHARYAIVGEDHETHIYARDTAPAGVREGDTVELVYLPDEPQRARRSSDRAPEPASVSTIVIAWLVTLLSLAATVVMGLRAKHYRVGGSTRTV